MNLLQLAKVFHALFLFIREMWLRDRTFRQFVRENLSFILVSVGFAVMTFMFVNLYIIVKDQEYQVKIYEQRINQYIASEEKLTTEYQGKIDWWKARYDELKVSPEKEPPPPTTTKATPAAPTSRPTVKNSKMLERWKRLNK